MIINAFFFGYVDLFSVLFRMMEIDIFASRSFAAADTSLFDSPFVVVVINLLFPNTRKIF